MSSLLSIQSVTRNFGGVRAIDDFSLELEQGTIQGLIGPNGAGKTTIFNCITGVYKPDQGSIIFEDKDITGKRPDEVAAAGIARTFQNIRLFSKLTVHDNVMIAGNLNAKYSLADAFFHTLKQKQVSRQVEEQALALLEIVNLADYKDARADSLPYGHQRRLEIARAIAMTPRLLLLDEPAAGMNAEEEKELVDFIYKIKERFQLTVLLIEHHMDVVTSLCSRCTVLDFGKTLVSGPMDEIKQNPQVIEAYLGGTDL